MHTGDLSRLTPAHTFVSGTMPLLDFPAVTSSNKALRRPRDLSRCTLWCIVVLAMALGFSQTLGAMHRAIHAYQTSASAGHVMTVQASVTAAAKASWLGDLFSGHDTKSACDQYDALSHADLAAAKIRNELVPPSSEAVTSFHFGWQLAAQATGFLARGPPAPV